MPSIQQAINQLATQTLGLAAAGSYIYRQSDTFKAGQARKAANQEGKIIEGIQEKKEVLPAGADWDNLDSLEKEHWAKSAEHLRQAATLSGKDKDVNAYLNEIETLDLWKPDEASQKADTNALKSLKKKYNEAINQKKGLEERIATISAQGTKDREELTRYRAAEAAERERAFGGDY